MRVIAGRFGGRRLVAPSGVGTRPTADRVKEALFSMLGDVGGLAALDLFAGTGALGIEALSRGASSVVFVERDPAALAALQANLTALGLHDRALDRGRSLADGIAEPQAEVRVRDALTAVQRAARNDERYDLVFLDPPYESAAGWASKLAETLPALLVPGARVVVESDRRSPLPLPLPIERQRRYGDTSITIHRVDEPPEIDSGVPRVL